MAQATFIPFEELDEPTAALANTAFTNIQAQSSAVDGSNIRIEGLNRDSFGSNTNLSIFTNYSITSDIVKYGDGSLGSVDAYGGWVAVQNGTGTPLRVNNGGVSFSYDPTKQTCTVRASVEIRRFASKMSTLTGIRWSFALFYYRFNDAVPVQITEATQDIKWRHPDHLPNDMQGLFWGSGSLTIAHNFYVDCPESNKLLWIELRVRQVDGATPDAADLFLYLGEAHIELSVEDH